MTVGFQFKDDSGNILLTIGDDIGAILGVVAVTAGTAGSVTNAVIGTGSNFYAFLTGATQGPGPTKKGVSFSGTTMSWDGNGPDGWIVYGVRNPSFPAPAAGTADFSVLYSGSKRLTRAMAQWCHLQTAHITCTGAVQSFTISHPAGYPPLIAQMPLLGYAVIFRADIGSTSSTYYVFGQGGTSFWYFVFGKVPDSTPSGHGLRLMSDTGKVMFDSRYKPIDYVTSISFSTGDWAPASNPPELFKYQGDVGHKYATIPIDPGFSFYSGAPPATIGTAALQAVGTQLFSSDGGTSEDIIYLKGVQYGSTPFVVGPFDDRVSASFMVVDVTGL